MKVRVHPADLGGCGYYRLIWPTEALAAQGHDVHLEFDRTYDMCWFPSMHGNTPIGFVGDRPAMEDLIRLMAGDLALASKRGASNTELSIMQSKYVSKARDLAARSGREMVDADVVVLQRPMTRNRLELIDELQRVGVAVVVEIDDDFHAIHKRNPAWKGTNPLTNPDISRDWLMRACQRADLVTCTTPALAERYGAHGRVVVLDNYVPERYTQYPRRDREKVVLPVRVGWSGWTVTHPGDLDVTGGGVAGAIKAHDARPWVVGSGDDVAKALGSEEPRASGWVAIEQYPVEMARMDVGIVPLAKHAFNEAKSHLKGLEFAAVGVPFVATPTGPYRRLADAGLGWLADSPAEWRYLVGELAQDHEHRRALSAAYRAEVRANWTVEANAWRWWDAWTMAHERKAEVAA